MTWNRRRTTLIASLGLVAATLAVVASAGPTSASTFVQRWCGTSPAPCVVSATLNGTAMHAGDPLQIQMIPTQVTADQNYTEFLVTDPTGTVHLATTDTLSVLVDLGGLKPESTEAYASRPDVQRISDGDGTYHVRYTGHPVVLTSGCTDTYPNYCTDKAKTQDTVFDVTVIKLKTNHEFDGFDRSQSADTVDGLFLQSDASGDYLQTTWGNSRFLTDGVTRAKAEARFRIPYRMLIADFKIPAPSTMVASSITGSVNGVPTVFAFSQDPEGGAVFVDISGVTFPQGTAGPRLADGRIATKQRVIRVRRGVITPMRPVLNRVTRVGGTSARVNFNRAKPRGARVTGYQARCQSAGHKTLTASGRYPLIVVRGLTRGRSYLCSVRAMSRVGPGAWSLRKRV